MKEQILINKDNPVALEKLYRSNKTPFRRAFNLLYPELKGNPLADCWNERLKYEAEQLGFGTTRELVFIFTACVIAGLLAKFPHFFAIDEEFFYPRNIGFIFLPLLMAYFAWKTRLKLKKLVFIGVILLASVIYINILPVNTESDVMVLICLHLPLMLWFVLGWSFVGNDLRDENRRLEFLKYNGDLVVISALILISGGIMTAVTIGLFSIIGFDIEEFYFKNVVIFGLPAVPIAGTYLIRNNPQLVGKVSPVIAKIFSPLVLVMLVVYLGAMLFSGNDPYNDREFLLVFNLLLIGVMAIIFFSVAEASNATKNRFGVWVLFLLSLFTIIVNGIALSAILFRISEWGFTPNRTAVLGGNILILINLLLVTAKLFKSLVRKPGTLKVGSVITGYLPVYFFWIIIVCFLFPLIFGLD